MKVCFVVPHAYPVIDPLAPGPIGGSEIRAWELARGLAALPAFEVSFVVRGAPFHRRCIEGVTVVAAPRTSRAQGLSLDVDGVTFSSAALRFYLDIDADVVGVFGATTIAAEVVVACQFQDSSSVLFAASDADASASYAPGNEELNPWGVTGALCSVAVRHADAIVVQTQAQARLFRQRFDRDTAVIRSPVRCDSSDDGDASDPCVLWVGKSDDIKRPEICADLAHAYPEIPFVMVMSRHSEALFEWITYQAPPNLRIVPKASLEEMEDLYRRARVLLNTSRFEGMPYSFLQAGVHGVPVLSLDVDPDGVLHDHGGGLVTDGDVAELSTELARMWNRVDASRQMGNAFRHYVVTHHESAARTQELAHFLQTRGDPRGGRARRDPSHAPGLVERDGQLVLATTGVAPVAVRFPSVSPEGVASPEFEKFLAIANRPWRVDARAHDDVEILVASNHMLVPVEERLRIQGVPFTRVGRDVKPERWTDLGKHEVMWRHLQADGPPWVLHLNDTDGVLLRDVGHGLEALSREFPQAEVLLGSRTETGADRLLVEPGLWLGKRSFLANVALPHVMQCLRSHDDGEVAAWQSVARGYGRRVAVDAESMVFHTVDTRRPSRAPALSRKKAGQRTVFVNFEADSSRPYGGGNISVANLVRDFGVAADLRVVYTLQAGIDVYLVCDPLRGLDIFKNVNLDEIIRHRDMHNRRGKIVMRVNDCDATRPDSARASSREDKILGHRASIDTLIFNSEFIRDHYESAVGGPLPNSRVIRNGCDVQLFRPSEDTWDGRERLRIVTHHWSSNLAKGYETYLRLWRHCQDNDDVEFVFIGQNVPEMFAEVPVVGPLVGPELAAALRSCHVYVTDSRLDSCPNHVLEGLCSGLPMLYTKQSGGGVELCELPQEKIGEGFADFADLLEKLGRIRDDYATYRNNVLRHREMFAQEPCSQGYLDTLNGLAASPPRDDSDAPCLDVVLCADEAYFVGLFACLHSVLTQTAQPHRLRFHFLIPAADADTFAEHMHTFRRVTGYKVPQTVVALDEGAIHPEIRASRCYDGGDHLLNLANYARLLAGEIFGSSKMLYLDADAIVQGDLVEALESVELTAPLYAVAAREVGRELRLGSIVDTEHDWKAVVGRELDAESFAFMGAPLLIDGRQWALVQERILDVVRAHNAEPRGLYKLFTMSLQNIVMGGQTEDLNEFLRCLPDCGSTRKDWSQATLDGADILDWSGSLKPWFNNGLHRSRWLPHDVLNLSAGYGDTVHRRGGVEDFKGAAPQAGAYVNAQHVAFADPTAVAAGDVYLRRLVEAGHATQSEGALRVLYVVDQEHLLRKMSRVRFWAVEALAQRPDVSLQITGPGWPTWDPERTLRENILGLGEVFDFVLWYKPLAPASGFDVAAGLPFPSCIRFNEMWDEVATCHEIDITGSNLIVCHHRNDWEKYRRLYARDASKTFVHIPHMASPEIFSNADVERNIDILVSGRSTAEHYPLRHRMRRLIGDNADTRLRGYRVEIMDHPGYRRDDAHTNAAQRAYAELLNRAQIAVTCSSAYGYRLGKMVEIPLCGAVLCSDLPAGDRDDLGEAIIEIRMDMSDDEILDRLVYHLERPEILKRKAALGQAWAQRFTPQAYSDELVNCMRAYGTRAADRKIFVVADELGERHPEFRGQKWICDVLKEEFSQHFAQHVTSDPMQADVIWYLAPWNSNYIPPSVASREAWEACLASKDVVMTLHHVDDAKRRQGRYESIFAFMEHYGTRYHAICRDTREVLADRAPWMPLRQLTLWVNDERFRPLTQAKRELRGKYELPVDAFLVGSFQNDTERGGMDPKLSKGPDLFAQVVASMRVQHPQLRVVLTGLRRDWIRRELARLDVPVHFFEMVDLEAVNELYNCLNLYIVASRCEGGPRALFEAGASRTPIISTDVGVARELLPAKSIWDMNDVSSLRRAVPDVDYVQRKVKQVGHQQQLAAFGVYLAGIPDPTFAAPRDTVVASVSPSSSVAGDEPWAPLPFVQIQSIDIQRPTEAMAFEAGRIYVLTRSGTRIYDLAALRVDFEKRTVDTPGAVVAYVADNASDKEPVFVFQPQATQSRSLDSLLHTAVAGTVPSVGCNDGDVADDEVEPLYWALGRGNVKAAYSPFEACESRYLRFLQDGTGDGGKYNAAFLRRIDAFHRGRIGESVRGAWVEAFLLGHVDDLITERCLVVSKWLNGYGGNQRVALNLIALLQAQYAVRVWSVASPEEQPFEWRMDTLCPEVHNDAVVRVKDREKLARHIRDAGYSFIVNNKMESFFGLLPNLGRQRVAVLTHNASDPFNDLIVHNQALLDVTLTVSERHAADLRARGLRTPTGVIVNPVEIPEAVAPRTKPHGRLAFVGRLNREKNLPLLLAAFAGARGDRPELELVVLGDGRERPSHEDPGVTFLGSLNYADVSRELRRADFLVLPSSTEGLPLTVIEAMANGIPCICSDVGGISEVVTDGENGLLFSLKGSNGAPNAGWAALDEVDVHFETNVLRLQARIGEAYGQFAEDWNRMSREAHETVAQRFAPDVAARATLAALRPVLEPVSEELVICTTAIPRGDAHAGSLGAVYEQFGEALDRYRIHHLVNLDAPVVLRDRYSVQETHAKLQNLLPAQVDATFLLASVPGFLDAYKRLLKAVAAIGSRAPHTWVWWLEDDWAPTEAGCDFLRVMEVFRGVPRCALALVDNAHLGSFRGGPLMSADYFESCFDLESLGVANDTCDPEKQYRRWLSGMDVANGNERIHRRLAFRDPAQGVIQIVHVFVPEAGSSEPHWDEAAIRRGAVYYERSGRFHPELVFETYAVTSRSEDLAAPDNELRMAQVDPFDEDLSSRLQALPKVTATSLRRAVDNNAITYVTLYPSVLRDVGRAFNEEEGLRKWKRLGDSTSYLPRVPVAIATTAINRRELHDDVLPGWIEWLKGLDPQRYAVRWFINVDVLGDLEDSREQTIENLRLLLTGHFDVVFLPEDEGGSNFLQACRRLSQKVDDYISSFPRTEEAQVVWLEDDWKHNPRTAIAPQDLIERYGTPRSHINLSYIRNNYIWALAPSIISYALFRDLHYAAWAKQESFIDPEHCAGLHFRQNLGDPEELTSLTIINRPVKDDFFDQPFLQRNGAYFTHHDQGTRETSSSHRHVTPEDFAKRFGHENVFIRITASFCVGGSKYGRYFLAERNIVKRRGGSKADEFYR